MFDSHNTSQKTSINQEIAFRDKYPTAIVDIEKFEIIKITRDSPIMFLENTHCQVLLNGNIKFTIHKHLVGLIQNGKFKIWYSRPDKHDRYVEIQMVEPYE